MLTRRIEVDGQPIAIHESSGRGPSVVLVHGNSGSVRHFLRQMDGPLGTELHLVALDLPGHGASPVPRDPVASYSLPAFARLLTGAARTLGLERSVFLGWSLGGHIVLEAAQDLPEAAGFCIFGTPPLSFPPKFEEAFLPDAPTDFFFNGDLSHDEMVQWASSFMRPGEAPPPAFLDDIRKADPRMRPMLLESVGAVGYRDETQVLSTLTQPLAILHGAHEQLVNFDYLASLHAPTLWRQSVQVIPDAGHAAQWENPACFDMLVTDFLRAVSS
jgi:pimeloyl-ACP methyl ester carboxylesterase